MIELLETNCQTNDNDFIEDAEDAESAEALLEEILNEISTTLFNEQAEQFYETVPKMMTQPALEHSHEWKQVFRKKKPQGGYEYD